MPAVTELRRTHDRWLGGRAPGPIRPAEAVDLNCRSARRLLRGPDHEGT